MDDYDDYMMEVSYKEHPIYEAINEAAYANDVEEAKRILCLKQFPGISKEERESCLFSESYIAFKNYKKGEDILKYLIFDYNIAEDNSINKFEFNSEPTIRQMFETRKLQHELTCELNLNDNASKKVKV